MAFAIASFISPFPTHPPVEIPVCFPSTITDSILINIAKKIIGRLERSHQFNWICVSLGLGNGKAQKEREGRGKSESRQRER